MKIQKSVKVLILAVFILTLATATALAGTVTYLQIGAGSVGGLAGGLLGGISSNGGSGNLIKYGQTNSLAGMLWTGNTWPMLGSGLNTKTVTIQFRPLGSSTWEKLKDVVTYSQSVLTAPGQSSPWTVDGLFDFQHKPAVNTEYRAIFSGDGTYDSATTTAITTYVKAIVSLAVKPPLKNVYYFSGKLTPVHPNIIVRLKIKKAGWHFWHSLALMRTNSGSKFSRKWNSAGVEHATYYFKAYFKGDSDHVAGQSRQVKVVI